jgi:hypothetical protein
MASSVKGISIPIASDTREYEAGIQSGVIQPTQDAIDVLDQAGNAGAAASDELVAALHEQQGATKEASTAYQAYAQSVVRGQEQATDAVTIGGEEQTRVTRESIKTAGANAALLVGQGIQGIDGTVEGTLGAINNAAIGVFGTLGGVGLAIGAGVSTVVSIVQALFTRADADTKQFKADVAGLTDEFIATGDAGKTSIGYIVSEMKKLADGTDDTGLSLDDIRTKAKDLHIPFDELAKSYAGGTDQLEAQIEQVKKAQAANLANEEQIALATETTLTGQTAKDIMYRNELGDLQNLAAENAKAAQEAKLYAESGIPELQERADLQKSLDTALGDSATATASYLDIEKGIFNVKAYVAAMEARAKALDNYRDDLESSGLSTAAKSFLDSQGEDAASLMLQGYEKSSPALKQQLNAIWTESGTSAAGSFTGSFQKGLTASPAKMPVQIDTSALSDAGTKIEAWVRAHPIKLNAELIARNGQRIL